MLSIYRRHRTKCKYADNRTSKQCRCPLWATGTLEGRHFRRSLKTRSFERAEQLKREIENGTKADQPKQITIAHALTAFIKDCEARNLSRSTLGKYRLLRHSLGAFAEGKGIDSISDAGTDFVRDYRNSWLLAPRTAGKQLERLRAFFRFCVENEWITKNPAKSIKAPQVKPNPTLPYSQIEIAKIMENADDRAQVFYRLLLHSGLRILDAAQLRPERIEDGKLLLYQAKTGQPVWCPLPPSLIQELSKIPLTGGFYFAVQSEKPESIAEYYRKKLHKIQDGFHAHRFRDTFAVNLLQAGVPLEEVSILLGHSSLKITEQHYAPWVASRQTRLEELVKRTWDKKLVRVK